MLQQNNKKDYLENNNTYYNLSTGSYIRYFGEHFHLWLWPKGKTREQAIKDTNNMIIEDGKLRPDSNVIDLGCGIGSLSMLIVSKYHCQVTAVNANSHQLDIAKQRIKKKDTKIRFIYDDIMNLRFKERFDSCFMIDVEPHLPNKKQAIRIIKNLLKPKGRLVMTAWLQSEKPTLPQKELLIKPFCRLAAFPFMETFSQYKKYFVKKKFKIIKFIDITENTRQVVDYCYNLVLGHTKDYDSIPQIASLVKDKGFITVLLKKASRGLLIKTAENIFLGPIYTKLCMDAGVFKVGYFVVEKE